jgi:integrase
MRTRFYIEKRKDDLGRVLHEKRPVFMSVSFKGKRVILGTGIKVDINGWDGDLQRVSSANPDSSELNNWLVTLEEISERTMNSLQHSGKEKNAENFRKVFRQLKPEYSNGFFEVFFQFMEEGISRWSKATYRKVRSIYKLLREFEDQSAFGTSFEKMDKEYLHSFTRFCRQRSYKDSTTYKVVSILIWFLNWATEKGFNVYREYKQFYKLMEPVQETSRTMLSLKWEELMGIKDHHTESRMMERAKDLFCFMSFTGIRYAELQQLKKEDLKESEVIVRKQGSRLRRVPLNKFGKEIYRSYENKYYRNNTAFPSISLVTMNKYLRELGKMAGLNREVTLSREGDRRVPLYTCLTAGIAVNTFIVNAIELQIPAEFIAEFTGIRNDSRVRKIKMDLAESEIQKFNQR